MIRCTISSGHGIVPLIGGHCSSGLCPGTLDVSFAYIMDGTGFKASWGSSIVVELEVSAMDLRGKIGHGSPHGPSAWQRPALSYSKSDVLTCVEMLYYNQRGFNP